MNGCVLVTGATGAVGPAVVEALCRAGYQVRVFARREPEPDVLPSRVEFYRGDLTDLSTLTAALKGCEFVVHMAALLHIVNGDPDLKKRYEEVNVEGTENVVKAALQAGVQRLIFSSTIAVYGESKGQIFTEQSLPRPNSLYARTKLEAEKIVLSAHQGAHSIGVVLRLAAVYGPRLKGNYLRLVRALSRGRFVPIGPGRNRRTLVYDKDVGAAVVLALQHPQAAGQVYNVTDGRFYTVSEIVAAISKALGKRSPSWYVPVGMAKMVATVGDKLSAFLPRDVLHLRAAIEKYTEDIAVSGTRICKELGFVPHYDLEKGWQEIVDQWRKVGMV